MGSAESELTRAPVAAPDYHVIFDALPGLFVVVRAEDPDYPIVAVSNAYLAATRQRRESLMGGTLFEAFAGPDPTHTTALDNVRASFRRVVSTGQADCLPTQQYNLPGSVEGDHLEEHYWSVLNTPMPGPNGAVELIIHCVEDVTITLRGERERNRFEELLQLTIDNVPGLVSYLDLDIRYRFANRRYEEWFSAGPLVGRKVEDIVGQKVFHLVWPYLQRALAGETVRFEMFLPYHAAEPRYVQVSYAPDCTEDGTVVGVVTMVQDISAQVQMREALRQTKKRLQLVFAQAPVAVALLQGRELVYELVNPSYQEFFPGRDLLGKPLHEAVPEVSASVLAILHGVLDTCEPFVGHEYLMPLDRDRDGVLEDSWFTFVYQPLTEADGSVQGVLVVAVDVTTQVRSRQRLERVNQGLEEFAYVASHDLQEPLRQVNSYAQLLGRRLAEHATEEQHEFIGFIDQGVKRMEQLIRDLLSYTRTVHVEEEIAPSKADLNESLADALLAVRARMAETGATITHDPLPSVRGDTLQISHVFQNLLVNALKYRRPDQAPRVHIGAEWRDERWVVFVRDNGIGFDPAQAQRIFGLFKRLHRSDEYPGTGLGLAICKRIVERYGGSIWAESEAGVGSVFSLSLLAAP